MKRIASSLCATLVALQAVAFAGGEGWTSDFEAAKKQASEMKKDLLIDFTGSDWCGWCIKLDKEVFTQDPFKVGVKDQFVLVEIDSPRDKTKLSAETQAQNAKLVEKYAVQGYPTILLTDAEGIPYASTGYQEGGPEKYVDHLNELRAQKIKRNEAFKKADEAEGVEKARILADALKGLGLEEDLLAAFYGDTIETIKKADPNDESGLVKSIEEKQRVSEFQKGLMEFGRKQDHEGALAYVDKAIKDGGFSKETTQEMMLTRGIIFVQMKKYDEALKAIDEAKEFDPESELAGNVDRMKEQIDSMRKREAEQKDAPAGEAAEEPAEE